MKFDGEHLLIGQFGHFFVLLAFVSALVSMVSYFSASREIDGTEKNNWLKFGRYGFMVQAISLAIIFCIVFFICKNHYYEYMYAYKHASRELESKYLLACIWEGQEGSFLLWAIWHAVLGSVLIFNKNTDYKKNWLAPVMTIISMAQFFLTMMILGIYVLDVKIGNSLFSLTRNEIAAPIFSQPNYLTFIKDGMGLNVLLRNYWMVIHPPVLFLGFASAIIPFAFAYAGLQTKKFGEWITPALPWALFCAAVLGVGIMMGGKWAYESLSFGGYWAWDPVENASLVPWLILVAGIHTMLIYRSTENALRATFLFIILSFAFVLYSTFLTRTGILGDTSVHSFTEAGKAINIMIGVFVLSFTAPLLFLFFKNYKKIPAVAAEESTDSREFWMFIGSLVFFLSAIFIIVVTSIPVYNKTPYLKELIVKLNGGQIAMPENAEFLYNKIMVLVAAIVGVLTAIGQYFKYKKTPREFLLKKILLPTIIASILTLIIAITYPFTYYKNGPGFLGAIYLAFFAAVYAVIANAMYISTVLKNNMKFAGGSLAHLGFTLMIAGMLISSSNKKVISDSSVNGINLNIGVDPMTKQQDNPKENLTLIRQVPATMGDYKVTYVKDSAGSEKGRKFFLLRFDKKEKNQNASSESFVLQPDVYIMKDNNMSSNPDTKSYLNRDIFTYITYAINQEKNVDTGAFKITEMKEGDTGFYSNGYFILNEVVKNPTNDKYRYEQNDLALMADITFFSKDSMRYRARPLIEVDTLGINQVDDTVYAQNLFVKFSGVNDDRKVKIGIKESDSFIDFVTVKTFIFPFINLVWLGLIIMALGIVTSMIHRAGFNKTQSAIVLIFAVIGLFYMFLFAN